MKKGVLLLHGITCNGVNMLYIAKALKKEGYICCTPTYPSTFKIIEDLGDKWLQKTVDSFCEKHDFDQISIVAHSMGGLLTRRYLKTHGTSKVEHAVFIGTPNHGSQIADKIGNWWLYRKIFGPAGKQLKTNKGIAITLGPAPIPIGVIAGTKSNWHLGRLLPHPNDGKVSTESAHLEGMKDYVEVHRSHMGLLYDESVTKHIVNFLNGEEL
jgi:pimeloyl-ACP methyl ester carboxylesterase